MVGDTNEKATKSMYKRSHEGRKKTSKRKSTLWRVFTSQIYTFMFDSNVVLLGLTCMAQREASCACVILVM